MHVKNCDFSCYKFRIINCSTVVTMYLLPSKCNFSPYELDTDEFQSLQCICCLNSLLQLVLVAVARGLFNGTFFPLK